MDVCIVVLYWTDFKPFTDSEVIAENYTCQDSKGFLLFVFFFSFFVRSSLTVV